MSNRAGCPATAETSRDARDHDSSADPERATGVRSAGLESQAVGVEARATEEAGPTGAGSVLVVDDEESLRYSLARTLRRAGYLVETAASGREGLDRLVEGSYDAVLTDVRLPDLSGLDVLSFCTETTPWTPVIVMTGYGTIDSAREAMRRGAWSFVCKPFATEEILGLLETALATPRSGEDARVRARVEREFAPDAYATVNEALRRLTNSRGQTSAGHQPVPLRQAVRRFERSYVVGLLACTNGSVAAAARLAGITRPNFHNKLETLGVDAARFR